MFFFKKRKSEIEINSKYKIGDSVSFFYKKELRFGRIYNVRLSDDSKVIYDIQLGGECPVVIYDVEEDLVKGGGH